MVDLTPFINLADNFGMPVQMMRYVRSNYQFGETDRALSGTDVANNVLLVNKTKLKHLMAMAKPGFAGGWHEDAVSEIYHEANHAYIDLHLEIARGGRRRGDVLVNPAYVKEVMEEAARYYVGTMVRDRDTGELFKSPGGAAFAIAMEAVAMYVGTRAATYWGTVTFLRVIAEQAKSMAKNGLGPAAGQSRDVPNPERIASTVRQGVAGRLNWHDSAMAERVFGYLPNCGGWFGSAKQCPVAKAVVTPRLKALGDRLLEGKVTEKALASPTIKVLADSIAESAGKIEKIDAFTGQPPAESGAP